MTGYTVHTGSTEKFAEGWDQIFRTGAKKPKARARKTASKKPATARPRAKSRKRGKTN